MWCRHRKSCHRHMSARHGMGTMPKGDTDSWQAWDSCHVSHIRTAPAPGSSSPITHTLHTPHPPYGSKYRFPLPPMVVSLPKHTFLRALLWCERERENKRGLVSGGPSAKFPCFPWRVPTSD